MEAAKTTTAKALRCAFLTVGINFPPVKTGAFFRVGQQVIRLVDGLEVFFRLGVARVQVWVVLFGPLAIGLATVLLASIGGASGSD